MISLAVTGRRVGLAVLDFLLPPHCTCCDSPVEVQGLLCAACFARTDFITPPYCTRCGVPFAVGSADAVLLCPTCAETPQLFGQARAALRYNAQGRRLILPFKHADRPELAAVLAPHMVRAGTELLARAELLVPVPLHRRRLFERRYNQAALLAVAVAQRAGLPVGRDALLRRRVTPPLGDKSAAERAETVREAFAVRPSRVAAVAGLRILLIDDVMTSGATANACTATLLAGGARAVDVLVAARVPDPRLN